MIFAIVPKLLINGIKNSILCRVFMLKILHLSIYNMEGRIVSLKGLQKYAIAHPMLVEKISQYFPIASNYIIINTVIGNLRYCQIESVHPTFSPSNTPLHCH